MHITVWNEYIHERKNPLAQAAYPDGIHMALVRSLSERIDDAQISTATLGAPGHGLDEDLLQATDVLFWWGHLAHDKVADEVAWRVQQAVLQGMGFVALHSAHLSKPFTGLMGTTCNLRWREADDEELLWTVNPSHPIAQGVPQPVEVGRHEMYGEFFDIPPPDELVFISSFSGGEVFRSGCCFQRGKGRVFYFSPGHETYPVYMNPAIEVILGNAARWAARQGDGNVDTRTSPNAPLDWFRGVKA